jgi:hypothetical protein
MFVNMLAKANVKITYKKAEDELTVELWDVDVIIDDLISSKIITASGNYEFLFETNSTGEVNPELEIRVKGKDGELLAIKKPINIISASGTFRVDSSCAEFGEINI